jgi:hypothetical protein
MSETVSYRKAYFPSQKLPMSRKTKKWREDVMDAAEKLVFLSDNRIRATFANKRANYDLANDMLDMNDVKRVTNPFKIKGITMPAKMQNYPIALPKLDLLVGEEMKRRFDWRVRVTNDEAVTQKEKQMRDIVFSFLQEKLQAESLDEESFKKEIAELEKFRKFEYQDIREMRATHLLKYLQFHQKIDEMFSKCFMDLLIAGEELACVEIINKEPIVRKVNPLNLFAFSNGDSPYLEDADIIVEEGYYPPGKIIDMFYEELKESDVNRLMEGDLSGQSDSRFSIGQRERPIIPTSEFEIVLDPDSGNLVESGFRNDGGRYQGAFDFDGNVRLVRCVWRSLKKIGILSFMDPETGETQEILVSESYKKQEGQSVKWMWINEWWEGYKIGAYDNCIYLKIRPRPVQFRSVDNLSVCGSGYIGTYMNINDSRAYSLLDRLKPYQYMYNALMYRTEQAFAKSYGKILRVPLHEVPDDWELDEWMNYLFQMNIMVYDAFKEGDKGAATGKLAGTMNQNQLVADLEMGNYIQQHINMMMYIKQEMGEIAGVTAQREGQIDQRELVGNVERAVIQSANITEKWFRIHENFKLRVLTTLLETAKYAYRNDSKKIQYITSDLGTTIMNIPGDELLESDYGLFVTNTQSDTELFQALKGLAQAGLQNDKLTFSQLIDIYMTDSMSSIRRKMEQAEENFQARQEQAAQAEQEANAANNQALIEQKDRDLDLTNLMNVRDNETKLLIEELKMRMEEFKMDLEEGKNKEEIKIKMKDLSDKMQMHRDKMKVEEKWMEVEKQKPRPTTKKT